MRRIQSPQLSHTLHMRSDPSINKENLNISVNSRINLSNLKNQIKRITIKNNNKRLSRRISPSFQDNLAIPFNKTSRNSANAHLGQCLRGQFKSPSNLKSRYSSSSSFLNNTNFPRRKTTSFILQPQRLGSQEARKTNVSTKRNVHRDLFGSGKGDKSYKLNPSQLRNLSSLRKSRSFSNKRSSQNIHSSSFRVQNNSNNEKLEIREIPFKNKLLGSRLRSEQQINKKNHGLKYYCDVVEEENIEEPRNKLKSRVLNTTSALKDKIMKLKTQQFQKKRDKEFSLDFKDINCSGILADQSTIIEENLTMSKLEQVEITESVKTLSTQALSIIKNRLGSLTRESLIFKEYQILQSIIAKLIKSVVELSGSTLKKDKQIFDISSENSKFSNQLEEKSRHINKLQTQLETLVQNSQKDNNTMHSLSQENTRLLKIMDCDIVLKNLINNNSNEGFGFQEGKVIKNQIDLESCKLVSE